MEVQLKGTSFVVLVFTMSVSVSLPVSGAPGTFRNILISVEDEERVSRHKFRIFVNQNQKGRQYIKGHVNGKMTTLSHFIIGSPPPGHMVDHVNRNPLDNTRQKV